MEHPRAGRPKDPPPVKYIAAVLLAARFKRDEELVAGLEAILGPVDYRGGPKPFNLTGYYDDEMGTGISRVILSFSTPGRAEDLVKVKHSTAEMERRFAPSGGRDVNIDPGYMDYSKVVLASFKEGPWKIYIGGGVYADPVLYYFDGRWTPHRWSFPDFTSGVYDGDLTAIRRLYRMYMREAKGTFRGE